MVGNQENGHLKLKWEAHMSSLNFTSFPSLLSIHVLSLFFPYVLSLFCTLKLLVKYRLKDVIGKKDDS